MSRPGPRFGLTGRPSASRRASACDCEPTGRSCGYRALRRAGVPEERRLARPLLEKLVGPEAQPPAGRHGRVELAQRAGAAVARVGVERQPRLLALGVDPGELGLRHVDLAADLERDGLGQPGRDGRDRPQVGRDVLAGRPVAAGGAPDEPASR